MKKGRSSHLCKSYVSQDGGTIKRANIPQRFIHRTEVFLVLDLHQSNKGRWEGERLRAEGAVESYTRPDKRRCGLTPRWRRGTETRRCSKSWAGRRAVSVFVRWARGCWTGQERWEGEESQVEGSQVWASGTSQGIGR